MNNPFAPSTSRPGHGAIVLRRLAASAPVLQTLSYQYPLKLIAPAPAVLTTATNANATCDNDSPTTVHTIFLLSYGGGLVSGDVVNLSITLDTHARLVLLTQGSTKVFPGARRSAQSMDVRLAPGAALLYLPDPVQPYAGSAFAQEQIYTLLPGDGDGASGGGASANLCVCDWVCEGRSARNESWGFDGYASRNEVYLGASNASAASTRKRLLLRDNLLLAPHSHDTSAGGIASRMDGLGVYGTLIIRGGLFASLGAYFMDEFAAMPRLGGRGWEGGDSSDKVGKEATRVARHAQEQRDSVIWTAAAVRGFVLVKFGAREVEGARVWLGGMLRAEGTVEREFGEGALLCLR
ncbi:uncharacterized protein K452DRAFT_276303 [Aplosporella prunicola CBS 121167]|uniref:Urease accessory protein UreD n=1 Tax=Aplosporella prunicola CBS 121167 TaxID=1176127 RepID=A0A6A6B5F2_9PEZI|nr:uncharacterized protein K452DRAFT_276303 [Aplosporella prunicola CBS 121167]KAF2138653.1 hypothetical protein K452DRAFT_276303 [Aplosporella prunicola CBS 121167]